MDTPPIWDELTIAIEAHLAAHGALLRGLCDPRCNEDDLERLLHEAAETWLTYTVKLTERASNMASTAVVAIIRPYASEIEKIKDRLKVLEDQRVADALADDS